MRQCQACNGAPNNDDLELWLLHGSYENPELSNKRDLGDTVAAILIDVVAPNLEDGKKGPSGRKNDIRDTRYGVACVTSFCQLLGISTLICFL